ncbi:hypothetical protein HNR60_001011 [Rhodopseudomonas rhenobacensis]|uniref:Uncharacterized protein n=1 Tax=Rhodopseudomonas rhenobacensis TaxID=87461 RepID=A0A7W8DYV3_9BRAD|nr:hypothetical protein [Rhodopseudomonas rhenobacensis]MBB5046266.1 hypothetical protein [Rhodopseudomonas rhenobacensis]
MQKLAVEPDGIVFGYTAGKKRTYKSLNYHRQPNLKRGKTIWHTAIAREAEYTYFEQCEAGDWLSPSGDYWWVSKDATTTVGLSGERLAFFPVCSNHPGPWHGYPVSAISDRDYEVPHELIDKWEDSAIIDDLVAGRMRKGKL